MRRIKLDFNKSHWANLPTLAAVAILWTGCSSTRPMTMAPQPGQKTLFIRGRGEPGARRGRAEQRRKGAA